MTLNSKVGYYFYDLCRREKSEISLKRMINVPRIHNRHFNLPSGIVPGVKCTYTRCIIAFLRSSFLESLFHGNLQNASLFSPLDQTDRVNLSYRGFVKIIPEVALLVPPIYTSESGKLSIGKPVKSVGREIKVFRTKQTRPTEGK